MSTAKQDEAAAAGPGNINNDAITTEHRDQADEEAFQKMPQVDKVDKFGSHNKTDPHEIALVKKLDRFMLPILWLMYLFNYLDRNAIVNARLNNLEEDLGLVGTQYNTCVSILFVGYIAFQIPSNMLLNRLRPSWYMAGFCLAWSIVSLLTYLANSYATMVVCRLLLGVTEAPFYPGALYLISMFYTRKEVATRMSLFFTANMLASSFSPLIAAGVFSGLDGSMGLAGWRWLFIIQGALSILTAILAFYFLPDHPLQTRWLTPEQRQLAHNRIYADTTDRREGTSVVKGLKESVSDWRTWALVAAYNFHLCSTSFQNFLPTVVQTLGFNRTITLTLVAPPYILAAILGVGMAWTSGRWNERTWHITVCKCIAICGFIISVTTLNIGARYFSIFLFVGFSFGINNILLGWVSSTVGQTNEKKSVSLAIANSLGNCASIYMPYLWPSTDGPRYLPAWIASLCFSGGVIVITWFLRTMLKRHNSRKRAENPNETNFYVY
ncbi:Major facilitator-type transporter hxnP [Paramyrothecium foliicola]|nr:Major facilitator-type transporter hxnP [Paramyrothecium foliicola]